MENATNILDNDDNKEPKIKKFKIKKLDGTTVVRRTKPIVRNKSNRTNIEQDGIAQMNNDEVSIIVGDETIGNRKRKRKVLQLKPSRYYLNNRRMFLNFINALYKKNNSNEQAPT